MNFAISSFVSLFLLLLMVISVAIFKNDENIYVGGLLIVIAIILLFIIKFGKRELEKYLNSIDT